MTENGESTPVDDGDAIHYMAVAPGTPVYGREGVEVGMVREMLDNRRENIFDGVIFKGRDGKLRFADAPEVARTAERGVTLVLSAEEADQLDPPQGGAGIASAATGPLARLLGRRRRS
ncbi:MAG: hypothetical protein ACHQCF_04555 [Solirubrobacterales bacterium]